jgi:enamine deaminase RidA (YjgF/YER057c/UK114 family)
VLSAAGFSLSDVVRLNFYTTDVDEFFAASETAFERMPDAALPAGTLLGVARLAYPELKIEIEATAVK